VAWASGKVGRRSEPGDALRGGRREEGERIAICVPAPGIAHAEVEMRSGGRPSPGAAGSDALAGFDRLALADRDRREMQVRRVEATVGRADCDREA
jgi:hypothetical protein